MRRFIFLMMQCCVVLSASCPSDRNQDHRPRVSCVAQSLTAVPDGIKPDTQVLVLTGNHFSSLSWSSYSGFPQLHELDLSHNLITTLEPPGPVMENLSVLRLSGNRLTGLGGLVFRHTPNLMQIFLDGNLIRSLHDHTFGKLPRLEVINLSQNKLPALPPHLLERVSSNSLKTFDLENNSISLMPDGFFSSKPELPYVYLSHNPWLCSCSVGYLHSYLNDQEHNVYKHDELNGFVPGADSVVCSGPPHLFQRVIVELEDNDFCPPDPPLYPSGDQDFKPISVKPNSIPQTTNASHTSTKSDQYPSSTMITVQTKQPTTGPTTARSQDPSTPQLYQYPSSTMIMVQTKPPTTARSQDPSTPQLDQYPSSTMIMVQTKPPTTGPTTAQSQRPSTPQLDLHPSKTTVRVQTKPPTIGPLTSGDTTRPEPHTSRTTVRVQTKRIIPPTSVALHRPDARDAGRRMLPWCWWLFAGFVLLCVLSALTSCFLCLWLLRIYLTIYHRLKHHGSARSGVILRAYRSTEDSQGRENEGESVSFLALEQLKDTRAVFRSVLFINQREEQHGGRETNGRDVSSKIELVSVDKEGEQAMSGEVFRKTLYRVISPEEEADGWREGTTARYRLILREERGRQPEMQWVVGEWELGDEGVASQRFCSLIGQPSTVTLE